MVHKILKSDSTVRLECGKTGEHPYYVYVDRKNNYVLYSQDQKKLFDSIYKSPSKLTVRTDSICFLLQAGVIPSPITIYEDVYIIGLFDILDISFNDSLVNLNFHKNFHYTTDMYSENVDIEYDKNTFFKLVNSAIFKDDSKNNYLFHSAGKDSNIIAIAAAKSEYRDHINLVTLKSSLAGDESELSKAIANKLGLKHNILHEIEFFDKNIIRVMDRYYDDIIFPCVDDLGIAYSTYIYQMPQLDGSKIIDGGGNDSYLIAPIKFTTNLLINVAKYMSLINSDKLKFQSESIALKLFRTPAEWCGPIGMSRYDIKKIYTDDTYTHDYWCKWSGMLNKKYDSCNFHSITLTGIIATEKHIRKVREFTNAINAKLIMPFMDQAVSNYLLSLPKKLLIDEDNKRNKPLFRQILKDEIGVDSDLIGKKGYTYNFTKIVVNNKNYICDTIFRCSLWNSNHLNDYIARLYGNIGTKNTRVASHSARLIARLFIISRWYSAKKTKNQLA